MTIEPVDLTSITDDMVIDYTFPDGDAPADPSTEQLAEWKQSLVDAGQFASYGQWARAVRRSPAFHGLLKASGFAGPLVGALVLIGMEAADEEPDAATIVATWQAVLRDAGAAGLVFPAEAVDTFNALTTALALPVSMIVPTGEPA